MTMPYRPDSPEGPDDDRDMTFSCIAFDPGATTGWAVFAVHPDAMTDPSYSILENIQYWSCGQWPYINEEGHQEIITENDMAEQAVELADAWPHAVLVSESFILRQFRMDPVLLSPVRVLAKIEFAVRPRPVQLQQPSLAKSMCTDQRLQEWGSVATASGAGTVRNFATATKAQPHARDAVRHAITYLRRHKDAYMRRTGAIRPGSNGRAVTSDGAVAQS